MHSDVSEHFVQLFRSKLRGVIFLAVYRMTLGHFIRVNTHKQHAAGDNKDVTRDKVIMLTSGPNYICQSHTRAVKIKTINYWEKGVTQPRDAKMSR